MTNAQKAFALGLLLINIAGAAVLTNAVEALGSAITVG